MGESFCPWERYLAIDLKSFFASVECVSRGLDPLRTNLVVADRSRTEKTICLAVTPALKQLGIPGRPRLFEVAARVKEKNYERRRGQSFAAPPAFWRSFPRTPRSPSITSSQDPGCLST